MTHCCIAGGGPAGVMLGFLLARSGIDVIVLEKYPDFFRDFRGDTIHPSTMDVLHELGLLERFLTLPHNETRQLTGHVGGEAITITDFTQLGVAAPFVAFIPQWDFLAFLVREGTRYPGFHLRMATEATELIEEQGRIVGVAATDSSGPLSIRCDVVVGADGRHSSIRAKARLQVQDLGAPIDALWFRLSRRDRDDGQSFGYIDSGQVMILLDRGDYWQCGYIIAKGDFERLKARGLEAFRRDIERLVPFLKEAVQELKDWEQVKMLAVTVDRLRTWHRPGLLCIGDAAHAMSPVGGVGINLAIQDAVAAANLLVPAFHNGGPDEETLRAVQRRRMAPARITQRVQILAHTHVIAPLLKRTEPLHPPWWLRMFERFPFLRRFPGYAVGIGFRPEHVRTPASGQT
jgi:2-polyprenyl-6-methoxyphenol hydroxylase-like FAD-dependent oxidoreductase